MVVNIVVDKNRFIGIDGNGIVVLGGDFEYLKDMEIWHGYFKYGPRGQVHTFRVNKSSDEYFAGKKMYDEKYLREMFAAEKLLIINKVIYF